MNHHPDQHPEKGINPIVYATAAELDSRLNAVFTHPDSIVLMGADDFASAGLLKKRFPQAKILEVDPDKTFLEHSQQKGKKGLSIWQKLRQTLPEQKQQSFELPLQTDRQDMLWSNLALHCSGNITNTLTQWQHILKNQGMLFSTTLGPDSLQELVPLLLAQGITIERNKLWDMHDLGDMLIQAGFADPITDMSRLNLTYAQAETFWADMALLRIWDAFEIKAPLETYQGLINQAIQQKILPKITLEIVYAHAVKQNTQTTNEKPIKFYSKKTC